ncbi:glutathione S-transferase domain containing protein [Nitzschia inconspicua]|uniref:Glutathione S-transferase domain containing protein n=1 Tax=Nitzschia inconspicua TaxID=303405 RepID=A0A9K3PLA1_9STRA|nr:glutathione S-transferase domain containing protein [Nitzschia inconspicua]
MASSTPTPSPKGRLPNENAATMTMKESSSGPLIVAKAIIDIWSTVRQCEPPSHTKTDHIRLITIAGSHYCEKVRWVLDMLERDNSNPYYYTEDGHPPGLHSYEPLKVSNQQASITPMVVLPKKDGSPKNTVLWESSKIVLQLMPSLHPEDIADQVKAIEADLGKRLGPAVRCHSYYHLLGDLKKYQTSTEAIAADPRKMASVEATLWAKFLPNGLAKGISKALGVNEETYHASVNEMKAVFAEMSKKLEENGGQYLMDSKSKSYGFTAADLTLAALSYPYLRPPEMEFWLSDEEKLPPEVRSLGDELRATKAGQHVLKVYKEHRPTSENGVAVMKYADRNRTFWQWLSGSR